MARVKDALGKLPAAAPPPHLASMLRVVASQERNRRLAWSQPFKHAGERVQLWMDNLMRPLALPFAGGLVSAVLLFGMLIPCFGFQRDFGSYDVPLDFLFTSPAVRSQNSLGISTSDDVVLRVVTDVQGKAIDYTIVSGPKDYETKREIENKLLFMEFKPATAFGSPTFGELYLTFSRDQVNVKS